MTIIAAILAAIISAFAPKVLEAMSHPPPEDTWRFSGEHAARGTTHSVASAPTDAYIVAISEDANGKPGGPGVMVIIGECEGAVRHIKVRTYSVATLPVQKGECWRILPIEGREGSAVVYWIER